MLFCKTIGRTNGSLSIANGYHQKEDRESYFITTFNDPTNKATRNLSGVKQRGERFLGTVTRGGAYGKAGGQNPQVPVWSALNTQKGNLETRKVSGKRVRGTWRSGLPALGPGQERAPEALPEPAVFSVPALQLLKLLGGQHHPTVRLAVLFKRQ